MPKLYSDNGTRKRVKFEFWLDVTDEEQAIIAEYLNEQKTRRKYHPTLREALKLLIDLRDGSTLILHELFPQLATTAPTEQFNELFRRLDEIATAPRPISAERRPFNPVLPDDDTVEIEVKKIADNGESSANFMRSMFALQGEKYHPQEKPKPDEIKQLANADIQPTLPNFDDLELGEL